MSFLSSKVLGNSVCKV